MGFWDFFKAKKEKSKVKISELESWTKAKLQEAKNKENALLKQLRDELNKLTGELEAEITILREIDVNQIKESEKVQLIVKENLSNYIGYLDKLIESLKTLSYEKPEELIEKVNLMVYNFEKKSSISYHKATYLIGKELGDVKKSLSSFFKAIQAIIESNKDAEKEAKIIFLIDSKIKEMAELEIQGKEINRKIKLNEEKSEKMREEIDNLEKEKEKIKESEKYKEFLRRKDEMQKENIKIKKEILDLKEDIDFKQLANLFHSDEKKMKILKKCKENFQELIENNKGEEVIELINYTDSGKEKMANKIREISEGKEKMANLDLGSDLVGEVEAKIKELQSEIDESGEKILKDKKRLEKIENTKNQALGIAAKELYTIGVEIE